MRHIVAVIFFLLITAPLLAQQMTSSPGAQPDLPGTLVLDFGTNLLQNAPDDMKLKLLSSRSIDIYYFYPIPFGESKFSFHPGIGLGYEKYSFSRDVTLTDTDSTQIVEVDRSVYQTVDRTMLATNYIDIPLEFRFYTKEDYRGLLVAVGGKVGRRIGSYTKIKYEQAGASKTDKFSRDYNLNPWRYGLQARLGFRGIQLNGYYGLSELFEKGKGPVTNNIKVGLTIALF